MPNPFPGVDPYIEANGRWTGFHNLLISACSELLNALLPKNYAAFVEERLEVVDMPGERSQQRLPDLSVARDIHSSGAKGKTSTAVLDVEPALLTLPDYQQNPEAYIDIRSLPDQELITSIEILSPTNKAPSSHGEYWPKRMAMIRQGINLLEIDLLLDGRRLDAVEPLPPDDFYAFVSRGDRRPRCEVFHWSIRRTTPRLPVALKAPDPDTVLDLAAAFTMAYERNRYDQTLRYKQPLPEGVGSADREWVSSIVKSFVR